jgi:hypothetical protein
VRGNISCSRSLPYQVGNPRYSGCKVYAKSTMYHSLGSIFYLTLLPFILYRASRIITSYCYLYNSTPSDSFHSNYYLSTSASPQQFQNNILAALLAFQALMKRFHQNRNCISVYRNTPGLLVPSFRHHPLREALHTSIRPSSITHSFPTFLLPISVIWFLPFGHHRYVTYQCYASLKTCATYLTRSIWEDLVGDFY